MPEIRLPHNFEQHAVAARIIQSALDAVDPAQIIPRFVKLDGTRLSVAGRAYDLAAFRRVHLLALGKAGLRMAQSLQVLTGGLLQRGLVITKDIGEGSNAPFEVIEAGHPIPDVRSLRAGQAVLNFLQDVRADDLLICAISGGGSALMAAPRPPADLNAMQALTARLLGCGASIHEINTLRRHLDQLKGGGLLRQTQARVLSLILSDVPGNALADIASGPTAADPTTRDDALAILEKYNLLADCPANLLSTIKDGPETLKPQDARLESVHNVVIGSNLVAVQAALKQAEAEGFHPYLLRADLEGEARRAARELCQSLRWACQRGEPVSRPFCMVAGGETTVTLQGRGRGGRNTELALASVVELAGFPDVLMVTLATDGEDGPTDAAGAMVNGMSWRRAEALGLRHPLEYLRENDSYSFFAGLGDLIETGPTGTNVNDIVLLFGF